MNKRSSLLIPEAALDRSRVAASSRLSATSAGTRQHHQRLRVRAQTNLDFGGSSSSSSNESVSTSSSNKSSSKKRARTNRSQALQAAGQHRSAAPPAPQILNYRRGSSPICDVILTIQVTSFKFKEFIGWNLNGRKFLSSLLHFVTLIDGLVCRRISKRGK